MTSGKSGRKDKNQNIQVFVRLRPLNQREREIRSLGAVEVINNRELVVRQSQNTTLTKKFTFDKAFGPHAKQLEIYQDVVSPLIEEVLAGYNCTVFAYGQTGTGKTHTMVGEHTGEGTNWQNDPLAGIIPRALSQLFDELRLSNTEYTVRVSYLELYNEELFDLLAASEDNSKLRIYEDVTKKGANIVNGLEEITVYNKNEVYKIMEQGQERKRVAATLLNSQSSRSHTVFTIVVHMKENSPEGEELVKIGKLNLVDLAGSENISKAGSDNPAKRERARECVNINQSLLTLGRVITALVERHPHIPYRESKLTRILQESLGGRTKTSIIATVSPGHKDLEETMSTLEYAHRARNIQNKPEVNQKMTKKAILKEYAEEIDRLKRDLQAARDKNGVYLANETYTEITLKQEEQRKEIQELLLHKRALEEEREKMEAIFGQLNETLSEKQSRLEQTAKNLDTTKMELNNTTNMLQTTQLKCEEQKHLVSKRAETEHKLSSQAEQLLSVAETAAGHVATLHDTVDKRRVVESSNLEVTRIYREQSSQQRAHLRSGVDLFVERLGTALTNLDTNTESHSTESTTVHQQNYNKIEDLLQRLVDAITEIKSAASSTGRAVVATSATHRQRLQGSVARHSDRADTLLRQSVQDVAGCVTRAADAAAQGRGTVAGLLALWCTGNAERIASLRNAHSKLISSWRQSESERVDACRRQRDARLANYERRNNKLQGCLTEIATKRARIEQRLSNQVSELHAERDETEERLRRWVEDEKRHFEERLARHVQQEKDILEEKIRKKMAEIQEDKRVLEEMIDRDMKYGEELIQQSKEECQLEEAALLECTSGADVSDAHVQTFSKAFDDGTNAISIDVEEFSNKVIEILEQINTHMLETLIAAKDNVESGVASAVEGNRSELQQLIGDMDALFSDIVGGTQRVLETVVLNVETNNRDTMESLSHLSASSATQAAAEQSHLRQQQCEVRETRAAAGAFRESVREELARLQELEGRYLMREYRVYEPTGCTPVRQEYRYPRALAATSPHERILARFRAARRTSHEDDCIVVEDDSDHPRNGNGTSDSESSVSEDSAVVFVAPSPPEPRSERDTPADRDCAPIIKSTSETELYFRKKQQNGKENERTLTSSQKKPSKLPAPQSLKRPLADRNTTS